MFPHGIQFPVFCTKFGKVLTIREQHPIFCLFPQSNKSATMFKEKANEINPLKVLDVAVKRIGNKLAIRRSSTDDADDSERPGDYSSFLLPGPHLDK